MIVDAQSVRSSIVNYCTTIGQDPLMVQGAGGNISWKEGEKLWIKVSGTWLAHAAREDIFVSVDLSSLRSAMSNSNFDVIPIVLNGSKLRPSIETLLHALMPQPLVLHLHTIEILAHLVRENWLDLIHNLADSAIKWAAVPYKKPGADLAAAVSAQLSGLSVPNVIFLKNHGIVIGGNSISEIDQILTNLTTAMRTTPFEYGPKDVPSIDIGYGYIPITDPELHQLAKNLTLFSRVKSQWALYPDHVVFLSAEAKAFSGVEALKDFLKTENDLPDLIFIKGEGVFVQPRFSISQHVQLRCYYDVLVRQSPDQSINSLKPVEINALINWDAEHYRMQLIKEKN